MFLGSLIYVQRMEVLRKEHESAGRDAPVAVPASSQRCVECHAQGNPGIVEQWKYSTHAHSGIGCVECHQANEGEADAFLHEGVVIAAIVTPKDCGRCHEGVYDEFTRSHHARAGNILASLDNFLAEVVEGKRDDTLTGDERFAFNPHGKTPGRPEFDQVNGKASVSVGCMQCHGSKVALLATDGGKLTFDDLKPGPDGKPTNVSAFGRIRKDENGKPMLDPGTWPNTGIGRINLDGSRGSCSACHSRHDFSPRRARQPENCGKCHLGPDHPQKEIYEESKHGVAYRDLKDRMNLDGKRWVLGEDYTAAPTCATCHMSGNSKNGGRITHDVGERISWTNRPPVSLVLDTDADHRVIKETDPAKRQALIHDSWQDKRARMQLVCANCHTKDYVASFYKQYDDLIVLYNEKFAKPGKQIVGALKKNGLLTKRPFDEKIEWTWFYLWHHEGRRARHGAAMMAPDYAHWHGMYEVAERFYTELIPEARELAAHARAEGKAAAADAVDAVIDGILARPEHKGNLVERKDH
ncbi:MAG TPA: hydroxylamine oxidoreductase [bacterium]|nr:hydroxylamine oxidoreductase [bacterium]